MKRIFLVVLLVVLAVGAMTIFNNYGTRRSIESVERGGVAEAVRDERGSVGPATSGSSERSVGENQSLFLTFFFSWGTTMAYYAIGVVIAVLIHRDARQRERLAMNIAPVWWGAIAVFDPAVGLLAYWVIHYSSISPAAAAPD